MNTATAIKWTVAVGAATTFTALLPPVPLPARAPQKDLVTVVDETAAEPGAPRTLSDLYVSLVSLDGGLAAIGAQASTANVDETIFDDLYVDLDGDLPPRSADRWQEIEVDIVSTDGQYIPNDAWQ